MFNERKSKILRIFLNQVRVKFVTNLNQTRISDDWWLLISKYFELNSKELWPKVLNRIGELGDPHLGYPSATETSVMSFERENNWRIDFRMNIAKRHGRQIANSPIKQWAQCPQRNSQSMQLSITPGCQSIFRWRLLIIELNVVITSNLVNNKSLDSCADRRYDCLENKTSI